VALQCDFAFSNKCCPDIALFVSDDLAFLVGFGFWQAESKDNDEDGRASTEPEEWTPSVRCGVHKTSCESSRQQVPKSIALLQHSRNQTTSFLWTIFQGCCGSITVQPAHCNSEQCSAGKELFVSLTETGPEFENDEKKIIDHEGPFSSISIRCETERN